MSELTRRSLVAAASLLPASAVKSTAANSAPSVGLIGAGNRGSYLGRILTEHTAARLTAVSDLYDAKMAAMQKSSPGAQMFKDYRDLLNSAVDAVIIATPVFLHAGHLEAAVQAGKHIYIEKPAASSLADCKRILRVVDSADRRLNISFGFQRRYGQLYLKAKQAQDAGSIDAVRWARVEFIKSETPRPRKPVARPVTEMEKIENWYAWQDLSGDLIVENNIHLIDVMNWFVGARPTAAHGKGGRLRKDYGDTRDHVNVTYTYPAGIQGDLIGTVLAAPGFRDVREQFHGAKGAIEVSETHWKLLRGNKAEAGENSPRNISIDSITAFVDRIANGKPENTGARGVESTLTAILGRMAMDLGREVTWQEMMASG